MPVIRAAAAAEHRQQRQPLTTTGMAAAREAGALPIEAIAKEVGYEDAGHFSRLFGGKVNLTRAHCRTRSGALRNTLTSGAVAG